MPMRRLTQAITGALVATLALLAARGEAQAADPSALGGPTAGALGESAALSGGQPSYWQLGPGRFFLSSTVEAGFIYLRPQVALGYGKPHWVWGGIEAYPAIASSNISEYLGLRAALRYVDVRVGARYVFTLDRRFLPPQDSYTHDQIEPRLTPHSRYVSLDAALSFTVPLPRGALFGLVTGYGVFGVPGDYYVFEEGLRVVVKPPFVGRARLGYSLRMGPNDDITLGAFGELIEIFGRDQLVGRVGPLANLQISDHLDLTASFAFVVASRDALGLSSSDVGQFGVRYRWASGEPVPVSLIP